MASATTTNASLTKTSHLTPLRPLISVVKTTKLPVIGAYAAVFMLTVTFVAFGYQRDTTSLADARIVTGATTKTTAADTTTALQVAGQLASAANLGVADAITKASATPAVVTAPEGEQHIAKPTVMLATMNRLATTYTTKEGDTVSTVAAAHNITTDTVKWANNLTGDTVDAGKELAILPVSGIRYTVKDGDTVASLSEKYKANANEVTAYNDLELTGATTGSTIIIPDGILPEEERPGYTPPAPAPAQTSTPSTTTAASASAPVRYGSPVVSTAGGNTYAFGNCTSWAYERRLQLGRPIGNTWGNAATWAGAAAAQGFAVNHTPEVGAVYQMPAFIDAYTGVYGHVGIVEGINADGSVTVSDMNYAGGFNTVSYRTLSAAQAALYNYIH